MKVSEAYTLYRSDVQDTSRPYLWSDSEVYRYMNEAYRMFVRLTGGIADFTSDATQVEIVANEPVGELSPLIMRIMSVERQSDGHPIKVINPTDASTLGSSDYGQLRSSIMSPQPGPVRAMVIGGERGKCRWLDTPVENDVALMHIYRLPVRTITGPGDADFEFDEIGEEHHYYLLLWMKHLGYSKADADTFNPEKARRFEEEFRAYCLSAKAEWERYKHKTRVVAYGGL